MSKIGALIFGFNEYSLEIANNIGHKFGEIEIFSMSGAKEALEKEFAYPINRFDLSEDWGDLNERFDMEKSTAFCTLDDTAENIFLTISLRSSFKNLIIIAIAQNKESADKLSLAGANKVIPLVQTTSAMIADMLDKPVITEVLHNILYEKSSLKIAQIRVDKDDYFDGKYPTDIEWSREHGVIVLSVMHEDMSSEFIYSSKAKHHAIKNGDIFVVVGYERDIEEFEKLIGSRCDVSWSHWSR
ncbi:MAG: NAD-binding protein [Epsilonproteobacteria bacterium]|nr:NAD-binding protein [Campylobacterota bacterium]